MKSHESSDLTKLSICIPTFNRLQYLQECVQSILQIPSRYHGMIQIVLSDNNSSDGTSKYLDELELVKLPSIHIVRHTTAVSPQQNWFSAICAANSKHILLLSDDDLACSEGIVDFLENNQYYAESNLVIFSHNEINPQSKVFAEYKLHKQNLTPSSLYMGLATRKIRHKLSCLVWDKASIIENNVFDYVYPSSGICLDGAILLAASYNGRTLLSDKKLCSYRIHPQSDTNSCNLSLFFEGRKVLFRYSTQLLTNSLDAATWFYIWNVYGGFLQSAKFILRGSFSQSKNMFFQSLNLVKCCSLTELAHKCLSTKQKPIVYLIFSRLNVLLASTLFASRIKLNIK